MKLKNNFRRSVASVVIVGAVLVSGVQAFAAVPGADTAPAAAVQSIQEEETPLSISDEEVPLHSDEEVPLHSDEEVPLHSDEEVPLASHGGVLVRALYRLLRLLGWNR